MRAISLILLALSAFLGSAAAEPVSGSKPGEEVLRQYLVNASEQRMTLRDVSMEVEIEAELPSLEKSAMLHALRRISKIGKITYEVLGFNGDNMVKKDVIARYVEAEIKSSGKLKRDDIAINDKNYKFKYRGMYGTGDWQVHLFEVKPRKRRLGLFRGWLWIEAKSGLPVRESGVLVKNPSVFLKRVDFLRDYEMRDGFSVPLKIQSKITTRLVGTAELTVHYKNVQFNEKPQVASRNLTGER